MQLLEGMGALTRPGHDVPDVPEVPGDNGLRGDIGS